MRRGELASADPAVFDEVARDCVAGYLALATGDGRLRAIAVNFAALDGDIVFHGALEGEKFALMQARPRAAFTMVKEYSFIPSTWSSPTHACPATQYFKSVEVQGRAEVVTDPALKARALQALMEKMQPGGGYTPIDHTLPMYQGSLAHVGVFRVVTESWTGKVKFGQNATAAVRRQVALRLRERGLPLDLLTADEIDRTLAGESPAS